MSDLPYEIEKIIRNIELGAPSPYWDSWAQDGLILRDYIAALRTKYANVISPAEDQS